MESQKYFSITNECIDFDLYLPHVCFSNNNKMFFFIVYPTNIMSTLFRMRLSECFCVFFYVIYKKKSWTESCVYVCAVLMFGNLAIFSFIWLNNWTKIMVGCSDRNWFKDYIKCSKEFRDSKMIILCMFQSFQQQI